MLTPLEEMVCVCGQPLFVSIEEDRAGISYGYISECIEKYAVVDDETEESRCRPRVCVGRDVQKR